MEDDKFNQLTSRFEAVHGDPEKLGGMLISLLPHAHPGFSKSCFRAYLGVESARHEVVDTLLKYINEAESIRDSLNVNDGDNKAAMKAVNNLKENPASLGAVIVLAINPPKGAVQDALRALAKKGAAGMLANDPKQYAKEQIYKSWIEWREGRAEYGKRNSQAAFAAAMRAQWDVIENVRSIENWCRDWKNGKNIPLIEPAQ